jgi:hypothetical protein
MLRKLLITFFVLLKLVYAQSSSDDATQQIWTDYNPQWDLSESFTLYGALGYRTIIPDSWTKLYFTAAVRYAPEPLFNLFNKLQHELHGELSFFYTFNEDSPNQIELRPVQGYKFRWPHFEQVKITHYLRLAERFFFTLGESDFNFELRGRYTLEAIFHKAQHLVDFADGLYFPISIDFLIDLYSTESFSNAIRITPGLGYSSESDFWKIQFDVSYQYTDAAEAGSFTKNTIIYRLRFYQAI